MRLFGDILRLIIVIGSVVGIFAIFRAIDSVPDDASGWTVALIIGGLVASFTALAVAARGKVSGDVPWFDFTFDSHHSSDGGHDHHGH
jgi:hypothetical protein